MACQLLFKGPKGTPLTVLPMRGGIKGCSLQEIHTVNSYLTLLNPLPVPSRELSPSEWGRKGNREGRRKETSCVPRHGGMEVSGKSKMVVCLEGQKNRLNICSGGLSGVRAGQ
jgi:hypothetical protein